VHSRSDRKQVLHPVVQLAGQCLLLINRVFERVRLGDHMHGQTRKPGELGRHACMTGVEVFSLGAYHPERPERLLGSLKEGDKQHFRYSNPGFRNPWIKALGMCHEDGRSLIQAHAARTEIPRSCSTCKLRETAREVVPAKNPGGPRLRLKEADPGGVRVAKFQRQGDKTRQNITGMVRHLYREVLKGVLFAQIICLRRRPLSQLIGDEDVVNIAG
jgi:hypothetical protein